MLEIKLNSYLKNFLPHGLAILLVSNLSAAIVSIGQAEPLLSKQFDMGVGSFIRIAEKCEIFEDQLIVRRQVGDVKSEAKWPLDKSGSTETVLSLITRSHTGTFQSQRLPFIDIPVPTTLYKGHRIVNGSREDTLLAQNGIMRYLNASPEAKDLIAILDDHCQSMGSIPVLSGESQPNYPTVLTNARSLNFSFGDFISQANCVSQSNFVQGSPDFNCFGVLGSPFSEIECTLSDNGTSQPFCRDKNGNSISFAGLGAGISTPPSLTLSQLLANGSNAIIAVISSENTPLFKFYNRSNENVGRFFDEIEFYRDANEIKIPERRFLITINPNAGGRLISIHLPAGFIFKDQDNFHSIKNIKLEAGGSLIVTVALDISYYGKRKGRVRFKLEPMFGEMSSNVTHQAELDIAGSTTLTSYHLRTLCGKAQAPISVPVAACTKAANFDPETCHVCPEGFSFRVQSGQEPECFLECAK